jgi:hypothetical protein
VVSTVVLIVCGMTGFWFRSVNNIETPLLPDRYRSAAPYSLNNHTIARRLTLALSLFVLMVPRAVQGKKALTG